MVYAAAANGRVSVARATADRFVDTPTNTMAGTVGKQGDMFADEFEEDIDGLGIMSNTTRIRPALL